MEDGALLVGHDVVQRSNGKEKSYASYARQQLRLLSLMLASPEAHSKNHAVLQLLKAVEAGES